MCIQLALGKIKKKISAGRVIGYDSCHLWSLCDPLLQYFNNKYLWTLFLHQEPELCHYQLLSPNARPQDRVGLCWDIRLTGLARFRAFESSPVKVLGLHCQVERLQGALAKQAGESSQGISLALAWGDCISERLGSSDGARFSEVVGRGQARPQMRVQ